MENGNEKSPPGFGLKSTNPNPTDEQAPSSEENNAEVESEPVKASGSPFFQGLLWGTIFTFTAVISATLGATLALISPFSPSIFSFVEKIHLFEEENPPTETSDSSEGYNFTRPVNILIMGIGKKSPKDYTGQVDTTILLRFDPTDDSVRLLSIPKNTKVEIPGIGFAKVEDINFNNDVATAKEAIALSLNNIPIDRYVRFTPNAFKELVDLLGGIEVFVPERILSEKVSEEKKIYIEIGWQTLNGEQALQFATLKDDRSLALSQIQREQILLEALRERLHNPAILYRIPQIVRRLRQKVDTNLTQEEMLALTRFSHNLRRDKLQMVMLPGRLNDNYWLIDSLKRDRIMKDYFAIALASDESTDSKRPSVSKLPIAIQNATDDPALASSLESYLKENNFRNVYSSNDSAIRLRETEIIVQQGDIKAANVVKKVLGFGRLELSSLGDKDSELTIRLGEDARILLGDDSFLKEN